MQHHTQYFTMTSTERMIILTPWFLELIISKGSEQSTLNQRGELEWLLSIPHPHPVLFLKWANGFLKIISLFSNGSDKLLLNFEIELLIPCKNSKIELGKTWLCVLFEAQSNKPVSQVMGASEILYVMMKKKNLILLRCYFGCLFFFFFSVL